MCVPVISWGIVGFSGLRIVSENAFHSALKGQTLVVGLKDEELKGSVTHTVSAPPHIRVLTESASNITARRGKMIGWFMASEFIDNSLRATRSLPKGVTAEIEMWIVLGVDGQVEHILFIDNGRGMTKLEMTAWLTFANDPNRKMDPMPSMDEFSFADGDLAQFGRGSKTAASVFGDTCFVMSKNAKSDRVHSCRLNKAELTQEQASGAGKQWERDIQERAVGCLPAAESLPAGLQKVLARHERLMDKGTAQGQGFTVFAISDLTDEARNIVDGDKHTAFLRDLRFSYTRYLEQYKGSDESRGIFKAGLEIRVRTIRAGSEDMDIALESWEDPDWFEPEDEEKPKTPYLEHLAAKNESGEPDSFDFEIDCSRDTTVSGPKFVLRGRIFYLPSEKSVSKRDQLLWDQDEYSPNQVFRAFWKGRWIQLENVDPLFFMQVSRIPKKEMLLKATGKGIPKEMQKRAMGYLYFDAISDVDVTKREFSKDMKSTLCAPKVDRSMWELKVLSGNSATGDRSETKLQEKYFEWLNGSIEKYDKTVTLNEDRTEMIYGDLKLTTANGGSRVEVTARARDSSRATFNGRSVSKLYGTVKEFSGAAADGHQSSCGVRIQREPEDLYSNEVETFQPWDLSLVKPAGLAELEKQRSTAGYPLELTWNFLDEVRLDRWN